MCIRDRSSLDPKRQNVVTLKVLGGLSHKEIAQLLSMPVGTVQWLYNTSIKSLRRTLTALASVAVVSASGLIYQATQYFCDPAQDVYKRQGVVILAQRVACDVVHIHNALGNAPVSYTHLTAARAA